MSRIYFHSEHGDAELMGSERAWLSWIARGPARAYWGLDGSNEYERAVEIMEMAERTERHDYLFNMLEKAKAEKAANDRLWASHQAGGVWPNTGYEAQRQFVGAVQTALAVHGFPLRVAGVGLNTSNLELNTALAMGGRPLALAAKIHGWCEIHAWVDGPDRDWLAGIMGAGLESGMYRRGLWHETAAGAERKWWSQGWESVIELLRSRDDGPVVMSYSVCDSFPNREAAGWEPPFNEGWKPDWADDAEGMAEWDAVEDKAEAQRETRGDEWYDLPIEQRWDMAMAGLRQNRAWAQISPDTLFDTTFHLGVTIFDLFAPDRDERVRAAADGIEVPADVR